MAREPSLEARMVARQMEKDGLTPELIGEESKTSATTGPKHPGAPWSLMPRTRIELAVLATDIIDGRIFGSWQIPKDGNLEMVFASTLFMTPDQFPRNIGALYEYYTEAMPRSVNGYPCFFSHQTLAQQDLVTLQDMVDQIIKNKAAIQAALAKEPDTDHGQDKLI